MNEVSLSDSQISLLQSSTIGHALEGNQSTSPQNMLLGHIDYFESKTSKKQQVQEECSNPAFSF